MQMFNEKVLIRQIKEDTTESGIIIPDVNPNADAHWGEVVSVPIVDKPEAKLLKKGDIVLYMHHNANPVHEGNEIVPFREIILKDDKKRKGNLKKGKSVQKPKKDGGVQRVPKIH